MKYVCSTTTFVAHPEVLKPLIFYNLVTIPTILATVVSVGKIEKRLPIIYEVFKSFILAFIIYYCSSFSLLIMRKISTKMDSKEL